MTRCSSSPRRAPPSRPPAASRCRPRWTRWCARSAASPRRCSSRAPCRWAPRRCGTRRPPSPSMPPRPRCRALPRAAGLAVALALESQTLKTGQPFAGTLTVSAREGQAALGRGAATSSSPSASAASSAWASRWRLPGGSGSRATPRRMRPRSRRASRACCGWARRRPGTARWRWICRSRPWRPSLSPRRLRPRWPLRLAPPVAAAAGADGGPRRGRSGHVPGAGAAVRLLRRRHPQPHAVRLPRAGAQGLRLHAAGAGGPGARGPRTRWRTRAESSGRCCCWPSWCSWCARAATAWAGASSSRSPSSSPSSARVLVAFALNLFGVFNVGTDGTALASKVDASHGLARSVGEGVLAVVLATPCSAPLMGTAVGFAFAAGPGTVLRHLHRAGPGPGAALLRARAWCRGWRSGCRSRAPWMERAKQLLGFALLGTAVWLVWVMGGLAGVDGMARLLAFLVAVGLGAWLYGLAQASEGTRRLVGSWPRWRCWWPRGGFALRFEEPLPPLAPSTVSHGAAVGRGRGGRRAQGRAAGVHRLHRGLVPHLQVQRAHRADARGGARRLHAAPGGLLRGGLDAPRRAHLRQARRRMAAPECPCTWSSAPPRPTSPEVLPELLTADLVIQAVQPARRARAPTRRDGGSRMPCRRSFPERGALLASPARPGVKP